MGAPRVPLPDVTAEQSTPFWGPDFDALTHQDPEIAGVVLDELAVSYTHRTLPTTPYV